MKNRWNERYLKAISENLTIKDIMVLCNCGQTTAIKIRNSALDYCYTNDIEIFNRSVPTEAVLAIIRHDIKYYYEKMMLEAKAV